MGRVAGLWRYPIKSHGFEPVTRTRLETGRTMPWDRVWAIAHERARIAPGSRDWAPCANFSQGAKSPLLMAIRARTDEATGRLRLTHPDAVPIEIDPDDPADQVRLIDWVLPLSASDRARPAFVVRGDRGLTDSPMPSISVVNAASLDALSRQVGTSLGAERFRANILVEGFGPWEELGWVGRDIRIGGARLAVREPIDRCKATCVDPGTGRRDLDMLAALESGWGHKDFGVYAVVVEGGEVAIGDPVGT